MDESREIMRYYREQKSGGKNGVARAVDYIALRLVFAAGLYAWFAFKIPNTLAAVVLSAVTFILVLLACRLWRLLALERFIRKERARLAELLLLEKLLLLPPTQFQAVIDALFYSREDCVNAYAFGLQRAALIGEDLLLIAYHRALAANADMLVLYGTAPLSEKAAALLRRLPIKSEFVPPAALAEALAKQELLEVSEAEIDGYIISRSAARAEIRKTMQKGVLSGARSLKYLVAAGVLVLASFLSGYALYYRLLACLCLLLGSVSFLLTRRRYARGADA
ncbi:MAG: hypothetical protein PHO41_01045 [Eubacteriales bacterium]|nr:hypothetical protein [Eubacteriales bacterium]